MLRTPSSMTVLAGVPQGNARGAGRSAGRTAARSAARHATLVHARRKRSTWVLPCALFALTLLLIAAHHANIAELFFPAGAVGIAFLLYRRSPVHYISFVCWLFFLSPLLRRLADFTSGAFNSTSPIMVAPLAAVSLCGLSLFSNMGSLGQRRVIPFVLIAVGMFYAFIVGMIQSGLEPALFAFVNWLYPALVGFHLAVTWRHYPDYHRVLLKTWIFGGLVMGAYGIWQYISPPPWDAFWILATKMTSAGKPSPYGLRIWSTMNSTGPFAIMIMFMLPMALAARGRLRIIMAAVAVPALMFTSVRSCWAGAIIGLVWPFLLLDGRNRTRMILVALGVAVLVAPVLMVDQISTAVTTRFQSLDNISQDNSYRSRMMFYEWFLPNALDNIAGQGLGSTGVATRLSSDADDDTPQDAVFDSGLMEVPYVMGWPGTLLYVTGFAMLLWRSFKATLRLPHDRFAICGYGVSLAILAMMVMVNTLAGFSGMLFIIGVMMPLISLRYARERTAKGAA